MNRQSATQDRRLTLGVTTVSVVGGDTREGGEPDHPAEAVTGVHLASHEPFQSKRSVRSCRLFPKLRAVGVFQLLFHRLLTHPFHAFLSERLLKGVHPGRRLPLGDVVGAAAGTEEYRDGDGHEHVGKSRGRRHLRIVGRESGDGDVSGLDAEGVAFMRGLLFAALPSAVFWIAVAVVVLVVA